MSLIAIMWSVYFFFFQAEDGIRDSSVTGVQTCALPICLHHEDRHDGRIRLRADAGTRPEFQPPLRAAQARRHRRAVAERDRAAEIGRASCRERVSSA